MTKIGIMLFSSLLIFTPTMAFAEALTCSCQQAIDCGADECSAEAENTCPSINITLSLADPAIKLCVAEGCFEGPARKTQLGEHIIILDGQYKLSTAPDLNGTQLTALLDPSTGIGMIQSTSEEGVTQYGLICQMPEG